MEIKQSTIVHGLFDLKNVQKQKYAVILYSDNNNYIITTFTTSQKRAGTNPAHGVNRNPECYVFKANITIGTNPDDGKDFSFEKDTIIVPDYGIDDMSIVDFMTKVTGLKTVCSLSTEEYISLLYFLYRSEKTREKYVTRFVKILNEMSI